MGEQKRVLRSPVNNARTQLARRLIDVVLFACAGQTRIRCVATPDSQPPSPCELDNKGDPTYRNSFSGCELRRFSLVGQRILSWPTRDELPELGIHSRSLAGMA